LARLTRPVSTATALARCIPASSLPLPRRCRPLLVRTAAGQAPPVGRATPCCHHVSLWRPGQGRQECVDATICDWHSMAAWVLRFLVAAACRLVSFHPVPPL